MNNNPTPPEPHQPVTELVTGSKQPPKHRTLWLALAGVVGLLLVAAGAYRLGTTNGASVTIVNHYTDGTSKTENLAGSQKAITLDATKLRFTVPANADSYHFKYDSSGDTTNATVTLYVSSCNSMTMAISVTKEQPVVGTPLTTLKQLADGRYALKQGTTSTLIGCSSDAEAQDAKANAVLEQVFATLEST